MDIDGLEIVMRKLSAGETIPVKAKKDHDASLNVDSVKQEQHIASAKNINKMLIPEGSPGHILSYDNYLEGNVRIAYSVSWQGKPSYYTPEALLKNIDLV